MPKQQPRYRRCSSGRGSNGSSAFKLGRGTGRAVAAGGTVEGSFPACAASICHDASPMMGPKQPLMQGKQCERDRRGQRIVRREG